MLEGKKRTRKLSILKPSGRLLAECKFMMQLKWDFEQNTQKLK